MITATAQKAAYVQLSAAIYHANNFDTTMVLERCKHALSKEMTIPTLCESIELVSLLVWPRFAE